LDLRERILRGAQMMKVVRVFVRTQRVLAMGVARVVSLAGRLSLKGNTEEILTNS
jgi:hypothetical protein